MRVYESGQRRFLAFCTHFSLIPLPATESVLCRFVAFLAASGMSYGSVRSYLSAVRHLHIMSGLPDPSLTPLAQLAYTLRGLRREGATTPRAKRLPITPALLRRVHRAWSSVPLSPDRRMLWAAFCLGFFGFLRAGEFTCPSQSAFAHEMLEVGDISVDSHTTPTHMQVQLKCSKTDPFGAGFTLHLGRTGDELCPIAAMLGYLAYRPSHPGFLFLFQDGSTLSRPRLCHELHQALQIAGVPTVGYSGHSFRIGAATTAARLGLSDSLIQTLGRWKSAAFLDYIRTGHDTLVSVSARLASGGYSG
jgi:hypothetical protein